MDGNTDTSGKEKEAGGAADKDKGEDIFAFRRLLYSELLIDVSQCDHDMDGPDKNADRSHPSREAAGADGGNEGELVYPSINLFIHK
jgi:hypothetical protein